MKKLLCIVLVLVLTLCSCSFAFGEEEMQHGEFEPTLTNALDQTASTWFQSSINRALFSVLIALDLRLSLDDDSDLDVAGGLVGTSYVGRKGSSLFLVYESDGKILIVNYNSTTKKAGYALGYEFNQFIVELVLSGECPDGYYENNSEEIWNATEALKEFMGV